MDYKDIQAGYTEESFWFKAKQGLIEVLMEKGCKNKSGLRILNVGAGTGNDLKTLNKFGDTFVIDIDENAISMIDNKLCVDKKNADVCKLPYKDDFFDVVVSFDVFEHIENDKKAIKEIYRVLKRNGVLIFTVPAFQFLFSSHDKALSHRKRYNKASIGELMKSFKKRKIFYWNSILFLPMVIGRLLKKKSKPKVDYIRLPTLINSLFFRLLSMDNFLIKRGLSMPVGLSIAGFSYK